MAKGLGDYIMQNIDFDLHSKARVWITDNPSIIYPALDIVTQNIKSGLDYKSAPRKAALEINIPVGPRSCYGLLGAKFIPNNSGNLSLEIAVSTDSEAIFTDSLAAQIDTVRIGLPIEYCLSVIEGIFNSLTDENIEIIGSGIIVFEQAAHGEISSSNKIFRNIASTVILLLLLDNAYHQQQVTEIVKTYSLV